MSSGSNPDKTMEDAPVFPAAVNSEGYKLSRVSPANENARYKMLLSQVARRTIWLCIVLIVALYVLDALFVHWGIESKLSSSLFDFLKFVVTSLLGYGFAGGDLFGGKKADDSMKSE